MFSKKSFNRAALAMALVAAVSATAVAAPRPAFVGIPDDSQSVFGGDGYTYFHEERPISDKSSPPFRKTNPQGLSEQFYQSASNEDPEWQPVQKIDKSAPAADPIPKATTAAERIARFREMNRFLQEESTP